MRTARGIKNTNRIILDEKLQNKLKQMKQEGQIVQAVKRLREQTGLDLVQARQLVERL